MNNMQQQQPQQNQPGAPQQQPGQMMAQVPGGQHRGGNPNPGAYQQQQQHYLAMAAAQGGMGMHPQMMMQQMAPQGPQSQGQPPQQQHFNKGGPQQSQQQYRQKQPANMGQQNQPMNNMSQGPPPGKQMMFNQNSFSNNQGGGGGFGGIPGDYLNRGMGPMMFPNQQNGNSPPVKRDRGTQYSLYIGNLSKETYDLDLYKFFASKGYKVQSAKVMFDKETNKSLGFGYLNFIEEEESRRCMEEMNNQTINGKQIVLNKKKEQDFDKQANVIVRNLPKDIDQKALMDLFQQYGKIGSCKLEVFADGKSRGFGYVQFYDQKSAEEAIAGLNDTTIGENTISVAVHSKKDEREVQSEKFTNLFVRNLPSTFGEVELQNLFKEFGQINSVTMDATKAGQGYVGFKDHEAAKNALEATNMKTVVEGTAIFVSSHVYKKESELQKSSQIEQNQKEMFKSNLYVKFIPLNVTKEEVEKVFRQAGPIISIKLKNYEINEFGLMTPKYQIGYVLYENVKQAQKAIQLFDEVRGLFPEQMKPLKVDFWQAKDERQEAVRDKHVNYVTQLINFVKKQNSQGYNPSGGPGMQGGPGGYGGQTQGYNNDGQQNYRGGNRGGYQQRGRGGYNPHRGGRGNFQRGGGQGYNKYNNQNRQYNNNGQMGRGGYQQQQNPNMQQPMGMQGQNPGQQQMGQQPPQQPPMGQQQPQQQQMMQQQQQQQSPMQQENMLQLPQVNIAQLDALQGDDRNNFVGNNIYQTIHGAYGEEYAPTITGMLLDESAVDFKLLLTNNQYFQSKAREAFELLVQSKQNENQMQQMQPTPQMNQ